MRLLDRYLFRELFTPLAYCLGGFLIFWISFDAFNNLSDFQDEKLRLSDIIEYYVAMTPEFLVTILPVVLLLALLYTLTNHARHNEITAMRAAGMSLWRVCAPYLVVGLAASAVLFVLNEWCVPHGADWADRIRSRYVQKPGDERKQAEFRNFGFTNARDHRTWFIAEYRAKTAEMLKPQVNWTLPDGSSHRLYADRAIRIAGVWTFFNAAEYAQADASAPLLPSFQTNTLTMPEFNEKPGEIEDEIKISSYQNLRDPRRADIPLKVIYHYLR